MAARTPISTILNPTVLRAWRLQAVERLAADGLNAQLRIAEIDRALGALSSAAEKFGECTDNSYAQAMTRLLRGDRWDTIRDARGNAAAPFLLIHEFLDDQTLDQARRLVAERSNRWEAAGIGSGDGARIDVGLRHASRAPAGKTLKALLLPPLAKAMSERRVEAFLKCPPVSVPSAEMEVVSYPQGGKFHPHRDQFGSIERILTAVIYLHKEPKRFQGGDLLLHDEPEDDSKDAPWFTRYIPAANSVILFPASCLHEVTQVFNDTQDPLEGRMAINVWMYARDQDRAPAGAPSEG